MPRMITVTIELPIDEGDTVKASRHQDYFRINSFDTNPFSLCVSHKRDISFVKVYLYVSDAERSVSFDSHFL